MFSPENQQMEICLLKSNLEGIGDDLLEQNSALPALNAENEQKYRDTMSALRVARSLNNEKERLNLENVKLTAKRMQLKRQCEDITKALERAKENREHLTELLKQEERDAELLIRNYEDFLRDKADRFRETSAFYKEEEMIIEIEKVNNLVEELESELKNRENVAEELKRQLDNLLPVVPENLLENLGKVELHEKIKAVTSKYEALLEKRNQLINLQNPL